MENKNKSTNEFISKDFDQEFNSWYTPFKNLIKNHLTDQLLNEFKNLEPKPKISLYFDEYREELDRLDRLHNYKYMPNNTGMAYCVPDNDYDKRVSALADDYYNKVRKGNLDKKYFGRYLNETVTYKNIYNINLQFEAFNKLVIDKPSHTPTPEAYAIKIFDLLNNVGNGTFTLKLIDFLLNDDENKFIAIEAAVMNLNSSQVNKLEWEYNAIKLSFDVKLRELKHSTKLKGGDVGGANINFESFLTEEGKGLMPIILKNYTGIKGQGLAFMLYALHELGFLTKHPNSNKTKLFRALEKTLGNGVGTLRGLSKEIKKIEETNDTYFKQGIDHAKRSFLP